MLHFLRSGFCCNPGHPEQNNIFGLSWNIPCVCATKRRRGQKNVSPSIFGYSALLATVIYLPSGRPRAIFHSRLSRRQVSWGMRQAVSTLGPNSRSFLCFGGSGGRIGGCPVG